VNGGPELVDECGIRIVPPGVFVAGRIAVRAPETLDLTRGRIQHGHASVAVSVGDVGLVAGQVERDLGGSAEVLGVVAPQVFTWYSELRQELAVT
jgi:hypothetical protein